MQRKLQEENKMKFNNREKYRKLDRSKEYDAAINGDPDDTQTAL